MIAHLIYSHLFKEVILRRFVYVVYCRHGCTKIQQQ